MMNKLKQIVEAALLAAGNPLTLDQILDLFLEDERPDKRDLREAVAALQEEYQGRGIEIVEIAGGFRINVREEFAPWVSRLWEERAPRYSRALLETLALIAYRQPITRGEIEEIRGVSVSSNIVKTLLEREWVRVVGTRDVPGKPSLYATTREFLNYFSLKSLDELPTLQQIRDLDSINRELELADPGSPSEDQRADITARTLASLAAVSGEADTDSEDAEGESGDAVHLAEVIAIHAESEEAAEEHNVLEPETAESGATETPPEQSDDEEQPHEQ